ncbi:MAG: NAD(P)H-binding protein, partial [Betaproteobacteria bacterium]
MQRLLIVGSGDVARRLVPFVKHRFRLYALVRSRARADEWRSLGVTPILADLDQRKSLYRLAGLAQLVVHLAPPPGNGHGDPRTQFLLAALASAKSLPRHLVYISTTGVYGDCQGERIDETRRAHPESTRAERRVDAETRLRRFGARCGVHITILRAPGIYAADRLPLERLRNGLPALDHQDDVFTNHIHADDLAAACAAALHRGKPNRIVNVVDDSDLRMGEYFDRVAQAFDLPPPPRIPRSEA